MTAEYIRWCLLIATLVNGVLAGISRVSILIAGWLHVSALLLPSPAAGPMAITAILVAGGLVATIGAAPTLLRPRGAPSAETGRAVFERFHRWGLIRAVCQTLAFPTSIWALVLFGGFLVGSTER